ncbi:MAG: hypothetical protein OXP37_05355, partial [Chloroflexota bacterium]|nr:hypothetical protein [Chloroflexota bacterium]
DQPAETGSSALFLRRGLLGLDSKHGIHELSHELCCSILGEPGLSLKNADLEESIQEIENRRSKYLTSWIGGRRYNPEELKKILSHLNLVKHTSAQSCINSKLPGPDREQQLSSGPMWWWDFYSSERLLERVSAIYEAAIGIYAEIVSNRLICFEDSLGIQRPLPVRIEGQVIIRPDGTTYESQPILHWWTRPMPPGMESEVDFCLTSQVESSSDTSLRKIASARVESERQGVIHRSGASLLPSGEFIPATELAHSWLVDDLAAIGWSDSLY